MRDPFLKLLNNVKQNIYSGRRPLQEKNRGQNSSQKIPRKILCSLTRDDIQKQWEKQNGLDHYRGLPMDWMYLFTDYEYWKYMHPLSPSVDRIDPNGDYTPDNIVICFRGDNCARGKLSVDEYFGVIYFLSGRDCYEERD